MADPIDVDGLIQITQIKDDALRYLDELEREQNERWGIFRQVIDDASWQYLSMRVDVVEEKLRDQGAPLWLSCVIAVGVSMIPITALTGSFLGAVTKTTQRFLTRGERAGIEAAKKVIFGTEMRPAVLDTAVNEMWRLKEEIKLTESIVFKFARDWEPDLANLLNGAAQEIGKTIGKQPFVQSDDGRKMSQTDAPVVVVRQGLDKWIKAQVRAEGSANKNSRNEIHDLFAIAVSREPATEAKKREAEADRKEAIREPRVPFRHKSKYPTTNKEALDRLKSLVSTPSEAEPFKNPIAGQLRDLQLMIETMIWATTYDFTPRVVKTMLGDPYTVRAYKGKVQILTWQPAPLPENLWKKLVERYIDPDEGKSYKDVGYIDRLGTKDMPMHEKTEDLFSPEVRLSHYFSQILYPQLAREHNVVVNKLSTLQVRHL